MESKSTLIAIDIPSVDHTTFTINFIQSKSHCVWLDWGDGTDRDSFTDEGIIYASHTYAEPGQYDITMFAVDDGKIELVDIDPDVGYRNMVTQVVIGDDVTKIHDAMFADCENMETLEFLCENVEIGDYAFANCLSLTDVELPTTVGMISKGMFFNCSSLKQITLPEGSVSVFDKNAFYGCAMLKSIDLSGAYSIGDYAFHGCKKLTKIELSESIHDIGEGAFDSCSTARTINLGNVEDIGDRAFCNCRTVSRLVMPSNIKAIGDEAFYNCQFLKELTVNTENPPVLRSTMALPADTNFVIYVPKGAKNKYVEATNWSLYADKIMEVE